MRPFSQMTPEAFETFHRNFCAEALSLSMAKSKDYANPSSNPLGVFGNLAACEVMGLCTVEQGIAIRLQDKMARLSVLLQRGGDPAVASETIRDTSLDMVNYNCLLQAARSLNP